MSNFTGQLVKGESKQILVKDSVYIYSDSDAPLTSLVSTCNIGDYYLFQPGKPSACLISFNIKKNLLNSIKVKLKD